MTKNVFKSERRNAKAGQVMAFMEVPTGALYWHLTDKAAFRKQGNSHSHGQDATVIHGLYDTVKILPEGWKFKTNQSDPSWFAKPDKK